MITTNEMKLVRVDELVPYANNARTHSPEQINKLRSSLREFGFINPVIIDRDNSVLAGHGRILAAKAEGIPEIPCVYADHLTEAQKKAYILADNRMALDAGWDEEMLRVEIESLREADFNLDFTGFEEAELDKLFDDGKDAKEDDFDVDAELQNPTITKPGDVWTLGRHRLVCGDSTKSETYDLLMEGHRANLCFTDPPYNVAIGSKNAFLNSVQPSGRCCEDIANDKGMSDEEIGQSLWLPAFENMRKYSEEKCGIYITMPQGGTHMMMMMMAIEAGWQIKHEIMWLKNSPTFSMGRLDYDYQHEPIAYGWNKSHVFYGKGNQTKSVWEYDKPRKCNLHPTMKPIELIANALKNSSVVGDIVLDPFGGSGSTLIACEQTDRLCRTIELDEKYCDVIVKRFIELVGSEENVSVLRGGVKMKYTELSTVEEIE